MRLLVLAAAVLAACSPSHGGGDDDDDDDAAPDAGRDAADPEPDAEVLRDAGPDLDAAVIEDEVIVWAHSATTLYGFDPRDNTVATVGEFHDENGDEVEPMTDLAVDRDGGVYTCSEAALYEVDPETAEARLIAPMQGEGGVFYGLTFLPEGVLDDGEETLVGATSSGAYFRIDRDDGTADLVGSFSDGFTLSGDIVSVEGAGTYVTVEREDLDSDVLALLDPLTGEIEPIGTGIGYRSLFGLGYWRQHLYGFSSHGELVDIDFETGAGALVTDETGTDQFWGAGVTTIAPIGPF